MTQKTNSLSADVKQVLAFDIVIVGGGIVGLSLANELANTDFSVAIVERNQLGELTDEVDCRVSAINRLALKRFRKTGIWQSLSKRACAFEKMFVWDQTGAGQIQFDSAEMGVSELGVIVENKVLQQMLLTAVKAAENISYFCPEEIVDIEYSSTNSADINSPNSNNQSQQSLIILASGKQLCAKLLVGADGLNSKSGVSLVFNTHKPLTSNRDWSVMCR